MPDIPDHVLARLPDDVDVGAAVYDPVDNYPERSAADAGLVVVSGVPSRSAAKREWVAYAVSQGEANAETVTRDDLIERFG